MAHIASSSDKNPLTESGTVDDKLPHVEDEEQETSTHKERTNSKISINYTLVVVYTDFLHLLLQIFFLI